MTVKDGWRQLFQLWVQRKTRCNFPGRPGSGLLWYLQPSPCHLSATPLSSKSYTWSARAGIRGHVYPGPRDQTHGSSSTKVAQTEWYLLPLPHHQSPPGTSQRQRSKSRSSSVETALLTRLPDRCSTSLYSQRVFWKHERTGTAEPVDCNVDGCHPHDIIGGTNSGGVGCSAT